MIAQGYQPKEECLHVEHLNKHHCHVSPGVWNLTPEMICAICLMKNHSIFVAAAVETSEPVKHPDEEIVLPFRKPRLCTRCSIVQLDRAYWDAGERICSECRWLRRPKLEQQCGR